MKREKYTQNANRVLILRSEGSSGTSSLLRHLPKCPAVRACITRKPFDEDQYRLNLARSIVKHNLPFMYVEYDEIRANNHYMNPNARSITRNTIKADVIKLYNQEKLALKEALKLVTGNIYLTSDMWTSIAIDGYLSLTAHYVDENWTLQKRVLNFRHVFLPHTGPALAAVIIELLTDWGIDKKIFTITLDNVAYNNGLVDFLKRQFSLNGSSICNGDFLQVRCGAHILNLIVHAGLSSIEEPLCKIRECVKYIKASEGRKTKFAKCIRDTSTSCVKKVSQDVPTRWNSTYLMLDTAMHFRPAFEQLKNIDGDFKIRLTEIEWEKIRKIIRIEELLCSELTSLDENMSAAAFVMKEKFDKYWEDYSLVLCFALILDPRFNLAYVKYSFRKIHTQANTALKLNMIRDRFKNLFDDYVSRSSRAVFSSPRASMFGISGDVNKIDDFSRFENKQNDSTGSQSEWDSYLAAPRLPATQELNILKYWKESTDKYPILASMVKDILAIPITTVDSSLRLALALV